MTLWGYVKARVGRWGLNQRGRAQPDTEGPQAIQDQAIWLQFQRIGGALTPAQISDIIREADTGQTRRLVDLANEMRQKDCHLQSVLQTRENAVSGLDWELVFPGQSKESTRGNRQRVFVEETLRSLPDFRRTVAHLSGAPYYGFAIAETIWGLDSKSRMVPARFVNHSARRFEFSTESGQLEWRDDTMSKAVDFRAAFPDKFIVSQPRVNGDVPCREGLVRVLMWAALFRNWTIADWLKLAEMAWKPWRIGKYKKTGTDRTSREDVQNLKDMLRALTSSGVATHPDTVEVELLFPQGSASNTKATHSELFEVVGREMSKAVLGQTLTTEQGKIGSQALGNVHNEVRKDTLEADALYLSAVITRDLVEPMVRLNFGPTAPVPVFRLITAETADLKAFAEAIGLLVGKDVRMKISANWARDQLGIPHPEEDEELLGGEWVDVDLAGLDAPANETPPAADAAA